MCFPGADEHSPLLQNPHCGLSGLCQVRTEARGRGGKAGQQRKRRGRRKKRLRRIAQEERPQRIREVDIPGGGFEEAALGWSQPPTHRIANKLPVDIIIIIYGAGHLGFAVLCSSERVARCISRPISLGKTSSSWARPVRITYPQSNSHNRTCKKKAFLLYKILKQLQVPSSARPGSKSRETRQQSLEAAEMSNISLAVARQTIFRQRQARAYSYYLLITCVI